MLNKLNVMPVTKTSSRSLTDNDHDSNPPIMIGSTEIKRFSEI